jgi:7,8-dihydro-6-hydroxymethylpterin dimethyltransferase
MDEYLTTTLSTCRTCGRLVPARLHLADDGVWFHKVCPDHGPQQARLWPDVAGYLDMARFHRAGSVPLEFQTTMKDGCPGSCGLCPEHEQHVCMPILEITDHCDLECPVCLVRNRGSFHLSRPQVAEILDRLIASEGQIDILNLSGGEPTMNPAFREIVEECRGRKEILYVSVSTNGLRLARDPDLLRFLAERGVILSLQFDGLRDDLYQALRGLPLLDTKRRLLDAAEAAGAKVSLTATVARGINEDQPPEIARLLFDREHVLSVMFQPAAYCGSAAAMARPVHPLTIPDVVQSLDGACGGRVSAEDFSPLPCSHPACFSLAYYLRCDGSGYLPIKQLAPVDRYLGMIENRAILGLDPASLDQAREAVYELWSGPAALAPHSEKALAAARRLLDTACCGGAFSPARAAAAAERSIKSIFIHHFMDRDTFDLSRARKCCNVYPRTDGRLVPACVYNCLER